MAENASQILEILNVTDGNYTQEWVDIYILSPFKEILIISFTLTFILGLSGNLLVIFVIAHNRSMHTVTNFFLANLAVADLLVSIFCVIPKLLYYISEEWYYGDFLCKIHNYVQSATTTSSIFILTVISMERFIAILRPLETRRLLTARRLTVAMAVVWIASATLNIHTIWYYQVTEGPPSYCVASADIDTAQQQTLAFFFLYYVIPLLVMVVLYGFICQKLWVSSKMKLMASDTEKKSPQRPRRNFMERLSRVRYLIRPRESSAPSVDQKEKGDSAPSGCRRQQAALGNPEEAHVLMETQTSIESTGNGEQRIGPFFLDEPDEDSGPSDPSDKPSIFKPRGQDRPVRIQVDVAGNEGNSVAPDPKAFQETTLGGMDNSYPRKNGHGHSNNNIPQSGKPTRPHHQTRLSPPRPLTISKPDKAKTKKNKKKEAITARKKVIKLLVAIVSSFALCLLPYQVVTLYMNHGGDGFQTSVQVLVPLTYLCYFFNSALNPFLYAFLSDNFRKRMKETLTLRSSSRRKSWMRTQARMRSVTEGNTETETVYTCS